MVEGKQVLIQAAFVPPQAGVLNLREYSDIFRLSE
jgi:hypothetical protein